MSGGRCVKHDNWHAHCQRCCSEEIDSLRAEVTRLKAALATARDSLQHQSEAAAQGWERAATYIDALNAEKVAHLATRTELDKAVAWLDRCQWARGVIDLAAGPLEVQLATALGSVERLTLRLGTLLDNATERHSAACEELPPRQCICEAGPAFEDARAALAREETR